MVKYKGRPVYFRAYSMEGGVNMYSTLLELLFAPIIVGAAVALFTYWLNDDDK